MGRAARRKIERRFKDGETTEALGITLARRGAGVVSEVRRSPEEQARLVRSMRDSIPERERNLDAIRAQLGDILRVVPTAELLARVRDRLIRDYASEGDIEWVRLEYLAWLAARETTTVELEARILDSTVDEVVDLLASALRDVIWLMIAQGMGEDERGQHARFRARVHELSVRGDGYPVHAYPLIDALFAPVSPDLLMMFGFDATDLLKCLEAIEVWWAEQTENSITTVDVLARMLTDSLREAGVDRGDDTDLPKEVVERAKRSSEADELTLVRHELQARMFGRAVELIGLTPEELRERAGVEAVRAKAFLDALSLEFGQPKIGDDRPGRYLLRTRPLLRFPGDRYLVPSSGRLYGPARTMLEEELRRRDMRAWERYEEGRAKFLERRSREVLGVMLPGATLEGPLFYDYDDGDGAREYELDGMVQYGPVLFLLEAKAGALSAPARRGAPSLREDLRALLGVAHEQATRALRFIASADEVTFRRLDGTMLPVRGSDHPERFLVVTTLETPQGFAVDLRAARELGVLPPGAAPWAVSLLDLEAIAELVEWGPQLIHYLRLRLQLHGERVTSVDELDLFANYLRDGLGVVRPDAMVQWGRSRRSSTPTSMPATPAPTTRGVSSSARRFHTSCARRSTLPSPGRRMSPSRRSRGCSTGA